MLPPDDLEFLVERGPAYSIHAEAGMTCIVVPDYALPPGLDRTNSDLLLRLAGGYPDVPPDMWWFSPAVRRSDGAVIDRTNVTEHHLGRDWQRWSRHLDAPRWLSGVDGLRSYFTLIDQQLRNAALRTAA